MGAEVEWSAVTGSHPPAATGRLPCMGFSGFACSGPAIGEKLWGVESRLGVRSSHLVFFSTSTAHPCKIGHIHWLNFGLVWLL